jgi:hypothetical protein
MNLLHRSSHRAHPFGEGQGAVIGAWIWQLPSMIQLFGAVDSMMSGHSISSGQARPNGCFFGSGQDARQSFFRPISPRRRRMGKGGEKSIVPGRASAKLLVGVVEAASGRLDSESRMVAPRSRSIRYLRVSNGNGAMSNLVLADCRLSGQLHPSFFGRLGGCNRQSNAAHGLSEPGWFLWSRPGMGGPLQWTFPASI